MSDREPTELSDIMEYLCEHFDASMDEHEVSRMSAMIRAYARGVHESHIGSMLDDHEECDRLLRKQQAELEKLRALVEPPVGPQE